jgi:acetoin utilization deacetylase AcuC-like enzyme
LPPGADDARHLRVLDDEILPVLRAYRPQLVLVSAGYDAHHQDPLGMQRVTEEGFAAMTGRVTRLAEECCDGRIVVLLEGGYDPDALARSVAATLRVLDGV